MNATPEIGADWSQGFDKMTQQPGHVPGQTPGNIPRHKSGYEPRHKPRHKSRPSPKSQTGLDSEPRSELRSELSSEHNPGYDPELNPGYNPEASSELNPELNSEPNSEADSGLNPGLSPETNLDPKPELSRNPANNPKRTDSPSDIAEFAAKGEVLHFEDVGFRREQNVILENVNWTIASKERWVILGPNGAGKTTLLALAAGYLFPTVGKVRIFGEKLGSFDVRSRRKDIGFLSSALAVKFPPHVTAKEVVMTAQYGALRSDWHTYSEAHEARALKLLENMNCSDLANREFSKCSTGERQRIGLARTLMANPKLVLLDEPAAGLDLGGREELVSSLAGIDDELTCILVTHHTEEIPPNFSKLALMRTGKIFKAGDTAEVLTSQNLSNCFDTKLQVTHSNNRYFTNAP